MRLLPRLRRAAAMLSLVALGATASSAADYRISGPHVHENLAVYLLHGASAQGPVPLTLQEAIAKGTVRVIETGNVNALEIENTGTEEVFVQAGDLVKGGKQDRVLTVSLLLVPGGGKVPIGAFCVEQGRWKARGTESVARFASSEAAMPSREARLVMARPAEPSSNAHAAGSIGGPIAQAQQQPRQGEPQASASAPVQQRVGGSSDTSTRQQEIWDKVKKTQEKLSSKLGVAVAAPTSTSSLQLSLENERLLQAQKEYVAALQTVADKDTDVVGMVVAVNGKLSTADIYPSAGLFGKMWTKQLGASVIEAIGERQPDRARPTPDISSSHPTAAGAVTHAPPRIEAVQAFLADAERGAASRKPLTERFSVETRDSANTLLVEASKRDGKFFHRSYLAK